LLKQFCRSQSGNFAIMSAITLPMLLSGVGLAVDFSTLASMKSKMQSTLDAALLASARLKDPAKSREEVFHSFLDAHLSREPRIHDHEGEIVVEQGLNFIEARAKLSATVKFHFMPQLGGVGRMTVTAEAYEATDALEVSMVLDNTGSMGAARMQALREAATALVDILEDAKSPNREVKAALVPFVTAVNVNATGFKESWIDTAAEAPYHGANFEPKSQTHRYNHLDLFKKLDVKWKGCVEARPMPHNLDDTPPDPTNPDTLFVPYFAPDNPGRAVKSPNSGTVWNNSYLDDQVGKSDSGKQKEIVRYLAESTNSHIDEKGPRTTGPNYACPTPIEPLTDDFAALKDAIGKMIYWEGSGTNVSEGLAWGMRVLSPGEPYTQGAPFKSAGVSKIVVVFTDGENTVFGASSELFNTSDYGSYGFLDSGRMGTTSRNSALGKVNEWTQTMCTRLKEQDVEVFTVMLGADTKANRELYSKCASSPANYYPTKDVSELKDVFRRIGTVVAQLYLRH
jgi:Flp pilus assembly protein TadG